MITTKRMSNRSTLRIGPIGTSNGCNAALLRDALLRHFRRDDDDDDNDDGGGDADGNGDDAGNDKLLAISNRYFDASVLLLELRESHRDDDGGGASPLEEDGVLLIFDDMPIRDGGEEGAANGLPAHAPLVTFDSLDRIHDEAVAARSPGGNDAPIGDLLRLCIGTTTTASISTVDEDEYSRRVMWCLDRGYEYVSVNLSEVGTTEGFDRRDKDGYARVIEAVETCMWSCRVMREGGGRGREGGVRSGGDDRVANHGGGEGPTESAVAIATPTATTTAGTSPADVTTAATDAERERAAMASLMNGGNADDGDGDCEDPPPHTDRESQPRPPSRQDEEVAFHQLERMLTEARCIREASRSNHMSDEERRARAGDAAMKLMGLLDQLGLDDDDDDDVDYDSDDSGIKEAEGR